MMTARCSENLMKMPINLLEKKESDLIVGTLEKFDYRD